MRLTLGRRRLVCYVDNRLRVNAQANRRVRSASLSPFGAMDSVAHGANGWIPNGELEVTWAGNGGNVMPAV